MEKLTKAELDYLIKLVESENSIDWNKAVVDLDANLHPDSLRKSFNVGRYCGYNVAKYFQDLIESEFMTDEEVLRLETLKDEVFKERCKLQDANREKRKALRDFSRVEAIQEYIEKKLDEREPIPFKGCSHKIKDGNEASALISDLHAGATVDSIFNYYDLGVLRERMEELSSKIISFCKRDKVDLLHANFLGDFITGIIHGSTIAQAQEDVIDQILDVCDIVVEFIKSLRKEIPCVKTYFVYGNHGRTTPNKTDRSNKENFERLIAPIIKKDLRNTDIKVFDGGYEDFVTYKLRDGKLVVSTHGTHDSPDTANKNFSKLLKEDVYCVQMGHLHEAKEGKGTLTNGSVMGSDDYSISHRWHSKPTQILKVYYGEDEVTYKLILN